MMRYATISFPMFGENFSINPPAFVTVFGSFNIYFYGMVIAFGFLLAVLYNAKFSKTRLGIDMEDVYDLIIFAVPTAIICARLYYVIFNFSLYRNDPVDILRIRDGGLAIYGGVIGAAIALVLRAKAKKMSVWPGLDVAAFGLLIGQLVGRWGNFFNREAYGYETEVFCRMGLTPPGGETFYVHPTFLYESLWNFVGLIILHNICKKRRKYEGQFFILYLFWYGLGRMMIEGLRSDSLWLVPDVIRVSQLLAGVTMVLALVVYIINARRISGGKAPIVGRLVESENVINSEAEGEEAPAEENINKEENPNERL